MNEANAERDCPLHMSKQSLRMFLTGDMAEWEFNGVSSLDVLCTFVANDPILPKYIQDSKVVSIPMGTHKVLTVLPHMPDIGCVANGIPRTRFPL